MTATLPSVSARPAAPVRTRPPSAYDDTGYRSVLPDHSIAHPRRQPHRAVFSRRWLATSVALLSAHGDIDATNAAEMTNYALAEVMRCQAVILDLHGLSFCGTDGFVALHRISVRYAAAGTRWAIVAGPAVSRLLTMCDPAGALPHASTMNLALTSIQRHRRQVTQPRGAST
jgi:anti-anti-sigma regulatory factor